MAGILAQQHFEGLRPLAEQAGVVLELLTGRDKGAERRAKLAALEAGDIQILVGTHAVFQQDVVFRRLHLASSMNSTVLGCVNGWSWRRRAKVPTFW